MPRRSAAWGLLLLGCTTPAQSAGAAATIDKPADALRCEAGEGPLAKPKEWPRLVEPPNDEAGRQWQARINAMWKRAGMLRRQARRAESCDAYIEEWQEAVALGYRAPLIPYSMSSDDTCARGWSQFLPYQVHNFCGSPDEAMPADIESTNGLLWKYRYLTGLAWFQLGDYEQAMECFSWIPRAHSWSAAARGCYQLAESYNDRQKAMATEAAAPTAQESEE